MTDPVLDPWKLIACQALLKAGAPPEQIRETLHIRERSYYYYRAKVRRLERLARELELEGETPGP
jgi:hypothetical protein